MAYCKYKAYANIRETSFYSPGAGLASVFSACKTTIRLHATRSIMLLVVIVALIATTAFYRQAKLAGVHPGKAASVPFIAAGLLLAVAYVASLAITKFAFAVNASSNAINSMQFMLNAFVLAAYLMLIRRNWLVLTSAPTPDGGMPDD